MPQRKETGIVLRQEELTPGMFSIWIQTDIFRDAAAGQFAALYSNDSSRLLPRPFGICDVHRKETARLTMSADNVRIGLRVGWT